MSATGRLSLRRAAVPAAVDGERPAASRVVDVLVVTVAVALALVPLLPVYGVRAALPAALGGVLVGLVVALGAVLRRWPIMTTIAATCLAYVAFGGPLAAPSTTSAGVLPTVDTLVALAQGIVTSWKQVLTLEPPLGTGGNVLVVPYVLGLAGVVMAGTVAAGRRHGLRLLTAAAVPVLVLVTAILFGTVQLLLVTVVGAVMTVLLLGWAAWRAGRLRPRRRVSLAIMLLASVGGGVLLGPVVAGDVPRFVLRSVIVPPFDPRDQVSPLAAYRTYIKDHKDTDLVTVRGLPEDAVVRLATMDAFDGVVWNVLGDGEPDGSGSFRKVGDTIPTSVTGARVSVEVEVHELDGVWMPTVGQTTAVDFAGAGEDELPGQFRYNDGTGTGVLTGGLEEGQTYRLDAVLPPVPTDEEIGSADPADVVVPEPQRVPDVVASRSTEVAAHATTAALVSRALEAHLHDTGFFSHGVEASGDYPSRSGHGAARITELLGEDLMVGDAEQYASAMALMVDQQGLPARVVMGFVPTPEEAGADEITFTGDHVQAWVEVAYAGVGWVPYFPTPPTSQTPQENEQPIEKEPQPQVVQPPPPPADPVVPPQEDVEDPNVDTNQETEDVSVDIRRVVLLTAAVAIPLLLLVLPPLLIVVAKERRRRRRRSAAHPAERISGGWDEVLDTARDHGTSTEPDLTRRETARGLAVVYPAVPTTALAEHADAAVFSGGEPSDAEVASYWAAVDTSVAVIRAEGSAWARIRGRVSRASLRARGARKGRVAPGRAIASRARPS